MKPGVWVFLWFAKERDTNIRKYCTPKKIGKITFFLEKKTGTLIAAPRCIEKKYKNVGYQKRTL